MVYKFIHKKFNGSGVANKPNYQLANELHKPKLLEYLRKHKSIHHFEKIFGALI